MEANLQFHIISACLILETTFSDIMTLLVSIYCDCVLLISPSTSCDAFDSLVKDANFDDF